MRALFVALLSVVMMLACGSDFETVEVPIQDASTTSTPEVVAAAAGGASRSDVVMPTTSAAGTANIASDSGIAATPPATGGATASGGAMATTTTAAVVPSLVARIIYLSSAPSGSSSSIETEIELVNVSKSDWDLAEYRLRYWFTAELQGGAALSPQIGGGLTTQQVSIGIVSPTRRGADHYIEIGFSKGSIIAGASERLTFGTHQSGWGIFDQSDDYSYPPTTLAKGSELGTVTLYHDGLLIAGVEP